MATSLHTVQQNINCKYKAACNDIFLTRAFHVPDMTLTISTREEMGRVCVRWCRCQPDIRVISIKFSHKSLQTRTISVLRDLFKYICWVHTHTHTSIHTLLTLLTAHYHLTHFFAFLSLQLPFPSLSKGQRPPVFFGGGVSWSSLGEIIKFYMLHF